MPQPERKRLRLPDHDYSSPGAYFVTICTKDRRCILSRITVGAGVLGGPRLILTEAGRITERYILSMTRMPGILVDKYVIMPNHVHMIVRIEPCDGPPGASAPTGSSLPDAIGAWKRLVHREIGQKIFQRSYYEHVIRGEGEYRQIWTYVDENPAKWAEDQYYA